MSEHLSNAVSVEYVVTSELYTGFLTESAGKADTTELVFAGVDKATVLDTLRVDAR